MQDTNIVTRTAAGTCAVCGGTTAHWLPMHRAYEAAKSVEGVDDEQARRVAKFLAPQPVKLPTRGICWSDLP